VQKLTHVPLAIAILLVYYNVLVLPKLWFTFIEAIEYSIATRYTAPEAYYLHIKLSRLCSLLENKTYYDVASALVLATEVQCVAYIRRILSASWTVVPAASEAD